MGSVGVWERNEENLVSSTNPEASANYWTEVALSIFRDFSGPAVFPQKFELWRQGTLPQNVFLIEDGLAGLCYIGDDAAESILGLIPSGRLAGIACAISNRLYPTSLITLSHCTVRQVAANNFVNRLRSDHRALSFVNQMLAIESAATIADLCVSRVKARARLEQLLWRLTDPLTPCGEQKLQLPLTREQLASILSVTPQWLNQLLHELELDGVIRRSRGWLIVSDRTRLWHGVDVPMPSQQRELKLVE